MLFIVFFRLFCNADSKEGCGIKWSVIEKWNYFVGKHVSDQFHFIICLGNWERKLYVAIEIQEVDIHNIQHSVQVLFRERIARYRLTVAYSVCPVYP